MRHRSPLYLMAAACVGVGAFHPTPNAPAAQRPAMPSLVYPAWTSPTPGNDALLTEDSWVDVTRVSGATHYEVCLRDVGAGGCWFQRIVPVSSATHPGNAGLLRIVVDVPPERQGTIGEWTVQACATSACSVQGSSGFAPPTRFLVPTRRASVTAFTGPQPSRTVTFRWTNNPLANAGSQLIILADRPGAVGFSPGRPATVSPPSLSIAVPVGANSHTVTLPPDLPNTVRWAVGTCRTFPEKGRRCSNVYPTWSTVTVPAPPTFASTLLPTFRHARCVNCHAVVADNYQRATATNPNRGLPSTHPEVNTGTNCAGCHDDTLLPSQGNLRPAWHAPPANMDFRNRSDMSLCLAGQLTGTLARTVLEHLTEDRLILWAVGDGRRPRAADGSTLQPLPLAPPMTIAQWRTLVQQWINGGMRCN